MGVEFCLIQNHIDMYAYDQYCELHCFLYSVNFVISLIFSINFIDFFKIFNLIFFPDIFQMLINLAFL